MNDDAIADLVGPYVDDDLPAELRARVETALLASPQLAWEVVTQRLVKERLKDGAGEVVASDAFRTRLLKKLYADNPLCRQPELEEALGQIALPIGF
jgi:anti-sigma factor RsiW